MASLRIRDVADLGAPGLGSASQRVLPIRGKDAQVRDIDETVVIEIAAAPRSAGLPIGRQSPQIGDVYVSVEICVAA